MENVNLWHVASACKVLRIMETDEIPLSHREQEPQDMVFAYLEDTAKWVSSYGDPSDVWVVFSIPKEDVLIGDLHAEGRSRYEKTLVPLVEYERRVFFRYREPEAMVSYPIKVDSSTKYLDRRTLKQLSKNEISKRCKE